MSVWQQRGMTGKAEEAAAHYGLTVKDLMEAEIPCQHRSYFGNSYAVVKYSDVKDLAERLEAKKQREEDSQGEKEHGKEKWAQMKREKADGEIAAAARVSDVKEMRAKIEKIIEVAGAYPAEVPTDLPDALGKMDTRRTFGLSMAEAKALPTHKVKSKVMIKTSDALDEYLRIKTLSANNLPSQEFGRYAGPHLQGKLDAVSEGKEELLAEAEAEVLKTVEQKREAAERKETELRRELERAAAATKRYASAADSLIARQKRGTKRAGPEETTTAPKEEGDKEKPSKKRPKA
jgi:hypothetical protein